MKAWKFGRSDEGEKKEPEMQWSWAKKFIGTSFGERLAQVFCHDSALVLKITVQVYLEIFSIDLEIFI